MCCAVPRPHLPCPAPPLTMHTHTYRLERVGFDVGIRILELLTYRERSMRRATEVGGRVRACVCYVCRQTG